MDLLGHQKLYTITHSMPLTALWYLQPDQLRYIHNLDPCMVLCIEKYLFHSNKSLPMQLLKAEPTAHIFTLIIITNKKKTGNGFILMKFYQYLVQSASKACHTAVFDRALLSYVGVSYLRSLCASSNEK